MHIDVTGIPAFNDNYLWCLHSDTQAVVVDPGDAEPVLAFLEKHALPLAAILITHHHSDHVGGLMQLRQRFDVPVFGPAGEHIDGLTHKVCAGDTVTIPQLALEFRVIEVPGHTLGHVAYYRPKQLFCGDTLFACGCGKLFEGTPAQMHASLLRLAALPDDTLVYCAHEYTLSNVRFAQAVEPGNALLAQRAQEVSEKRRQGLPTVPSTIKLEKDTNPFLRTDVPEVIAAARKAGARDNQGDHVFAALREWKNRF